MSDNSKADIELDGADPKLPFYIVGNLNLDGSVDISSEGKDPLSLVVAMAHAQEIVEDSGGTIFVIECRVIRKVSRGRVRIETIKTKPSSGLCAVMGGARCGSEREWTQDEIDETMFCDDEDGDDAYEACGRWNGGHLTQQCRLAGTEQCDWECPPWHASAPLPASR